MSALMLDVTRTYMEMRPELRRVYGRDERPDRRRRLVRDGDGLPPARGRRRHASCMDFGPASVDGWLADLGARERLEAGEEDAGTA